MVATIDKDKFSTTQFEVDLVRLVNNSLQTYQNDNTLELFAHGTGYVDFPDTSAIRIATGTTGQRPGTPQEGMVRFNTNSLNFEGYDGAFWNVLGGSKGIIIDQDQNTYMTAELTQGANDDTIRSYIAGTVRADLNGTRFNTPRVHTDVISTEGTDANLTITPNGTGKVIIGDLEIDQTTNTITNVETNGRTTFDVPNGEGWVSFAGSYGIKVPTGDINNRPIGTPDTGLLRYNTGLGRLEIWTGTTWGSVVGAGGGATLQEAEDLSIINALIFG